MISVHSTDIAEYISRRKRVIFVILVCLSVCLSVCQIPFVYSKLEHRRKKDDTAVFLKYSIFHIRAISAQISPKLHTLYAAVFAA